MATSTSSRAKRASAAELVIITGLSGSGKGTFLRALEDIGFYTVDNLPVDLLPTFAELTQHATDIRRAAIVIDVREGKALARFPDLFRELRARVRMTLVFLEADEAAISRRFSETRRPHPLGKGRSLGRSIAAERERLAPIRALAEPVINTTHLTANQLRKLIVEKFSSARTGPPIAVSVVSFGFKNGLPSDADLVFDVRFLPNPNYVPELRKKTGKDAEVARFLHAQPQTEEFVGKIAELLLYLVPLYIKEGKSYLTIAFGCTGGHHRSVMIADEVRARLAKAGYRARGSHRDIKKEY